MDVPRDENKSKISFFPYVIKKKQRSIAGGKLDLQ